MVIVIDIKQVIRYDVLQVVSYWIQLLSGYLYFIIISGICISNNFIFREDDRCIIYFYCIIISVYKGIGDGFRKQFDVVKVFRICKWIKVVRIEEEIIFVCCNISIMCVYFNFMKLVKIIFVRNSSVVINFY